MGDLLKGRIAVVTAAGQGIGRAVAEALREEGAEVFASDINAALLHDLDGQTAQLDATDHDAVHRYFGQFEKVDILVHAVGFVHQGTIEETTPEDWRKSCSITLDSAYNTIGAAVPRMNQAGGSITTIASVASSLKGFPKRAAYGAAKGGLIGLTKAVAADYLSSGIRCNAVCPGTVESPSLRERIEELAVQMGSREKATDFFMSRQPSGRLGQPEEIAAVCTFLASDRASFITGQTINVDGGITI